MSLPIFQTSDKDLNMMQTRWATEINPILGNPLNSASLLKNITLTTGNNTINHLRGVPLNGYIVAGMRGGFSQIYNVVSTMPSLTLILNSSAAVTIDLLVF